MSDTVSTIAQLEACIGVANLAVKMKIIDHLDAGARDWIAASPIGFVAFSGDDGPKIAMAGGEPGFAVVTEAGRLVLPRTAFDAIGRIEPGQGAGVLFLVPGIGETLRANGRVQCADDAAIEISVDECFLHCAKSLIRSDFWSEAPSPAPVGGTALLNATRFMALATMDCAGRIDVSPKGDPAGLLVRAEDATAVLAERPGNRLAFGYRNMIEQPRVAAILLVPGSVRAVAICGRAHLTTNEATRGAFVVDGKAPILATVIEQVAAEIFESAALARARLWQNARAVPSIDPSAVLVAHLKMNKTRDPQAVSLRAAINRTLVAKDLEDAYRHSLY